jgi:hypothetical protein
VPAEVALLGVCCAVLIAVAAVVIRRGRARRPLPRRITSDIVHDVGDAHTEADTVAQGPDGAAGAPPAGPRATVLVAAATAIAVIVGAAVAVLVVHDQGAASRHSNTAAVGPGPGLDPATGGGAPAATKSASGKHPAKAAHAAGSPGPGKHPAKAGTAAAAGGSGSGGGAPASPASAQTTPPPGAGTFTVPSSVRLTAVQAGVTYSASFTVTAGNVPVTYTAAEPSGEDGDYTISIPNASGTLTAAGQTETVTVSVTVLDDIEDPYVTMNNGATVTFTYPAVKIPTCPPKLPCP